MNASPAADDNREAESQGQTNVSEETFPETETASLIIGNVGDVTTAREPAINVAKRCHVGAIRDRNEDACLIFSSETGGHFLLRPFGLYIVADGMGGHQNGHVASKIASRVVARQILHKLYLPLLQSEATASQAPVQEVMAEAVQAANTAVFEADPESDSGTTLTAALILGRRLFIAHVGDSRLYLLTDGKLELLTSDHSLVRRLQEVGHITAEEATFHRYGHVLLRAVGQGEEVEIDTSTRSLPERGKLLLCSDGLCGFVSDLALQEIMKQDLSPDEIADQLFEAAMAAGGTDNITAILVEFSL